MLNTRSIIFIFSLIALLTFILGFRYGRKVDTFEKTYVPPTPRPEATSTPFPTPTPFSQEFSEFIHKDCGISFILPNAFQKENVSSIEAQINIQKKRISISCDKKKVAEIRLALADLQETSTTKVGSQLIKVYSAPNDNNRWVILNSLNQKYVYFLTPKGLTPLIISTLKLVGK